MESCPGVVCLEALDGAAGILISRRRIVLGIHLRAGESARASSGEKACWRRTRSGTRYGSAQTPERESSCSGNGVKPGAIQIRSLPFFDVFVYLPAMSTLVCTRQATSQAHHDTRTLRAVLSEAPSLLRGRS